MSAVGRFVVLGAARPRSDWFRTLSRWATTAAIPVEFVKCISTDEVSARLRTARRLSAVVLEGGLPGVDRDLLDRVREVGCAPIVVDDAGRTAEWMAIGAAAVLAPPLDRSSLLDALVTHAVAVPRAELDATALVELDGDVPWSGRVAAVCGPGGTGSSTLAAALAQGLAASGEWGSPVLLADFCRRADQAMLHDVGDVAPGVQELVEGHRLRSLAPSEVTALTFEPPDRGYHLLLGLRRPHHWAAIPPRAFGAALDGVCRAFAVTVCDVDADVEGEDESGSVDVEERNAMARISAGRADAVFVVGHRGVAGLHGIVRAIGDLVALGVAPERIQPVVNHAPRSPRDRAATTQALASLVEPVAGRALPAPVFVPTRRVDAAVRDGRPLPAPLPRLLAGAFGAIVRRAEARQVACGDAALEPVPVVPGSLGSWSEEVG